MLYESSGWSLKPQGIHRSLAYILLCGLSVFLLLFRFVLWNSRAQTSNVHICTYVHMWSPPNVSVSFMSWAWAVSDKILFTFRLAAVSRFSRFFGTTKYTYVYVCLFVCTTLTRYDYEFYENCCREVRKRICTYMHMYVHAIQQLWRTLRFALALRWCRFLIEDRDWAHISASWKVYTYTNVHTYICRYVYICLGRLWVAGWPLATVVVYYIILYFFVFADSDCWLFVLAQVTWRARASVVRVFWRARCPLSAHHFFPRQFFGLLSSHFNGLFLYFLRLWLFRNCFRQSICARVHLLNVLETALVFHSWNQIKRPFINKLELPLLFLLSYTIHNLNIHKTPAHMYIRTYVFWYCF